MDTSDACVSCRFTQIHPVYLNPPAMHAATPTTSNPFLLKYHFFVCWNNPVRNEAQIHVWLVLILNCLRPILQNIVEISVFCYCACWDYYLFSLYNNELLLQSNKADGGCIWMIICQQRDCSSCQNFLKLFYCL